MSEFFEKYGKYLLIGGGVTLLALLIVLFSMFFGKPESTTPPTPSNPNQLDYNFLTEPNYSREEQYLLLTAKILVEEFGTYSSQNLVGLLDVQNQSSPSFKTVVTNRINSINSQTNMETVVDPDAMELIRNSDSSVTVVMGAESTNLATNEKVSSQTSVQFIKQGEYWLVNNISSK